MIINTNKDTYAFITENLMESEIIFDDSYILIEEIQRENKNSKIIVKIESRR